MSRGKKSIFARQIAAQRLKEGAASLCTPETVQTCDSSMETDQCHAGDDRELACLNGSSVFVKVSLYFISMALFYSPIAASGPRLVSGQGLLGPDSTGETQRIHKENQAKLQEMSQSEILDEQKKLLSQLGSFCFIYLCIMYIINY